MPRESATIPSSRVVIPRATNINHIRHWRAFGADAGLGAGHVMAHLIPVTTRVAGPVAIGARWMIFAVAGGVAPSRSVGSCFQKPVCSQGTNVD